MAIIMTIFMTPLPCEARGGLSRHIGQAGNRPTFGNYLKKVLDISSVMVYFPLYHNERHSKGGKGNESNRLCQGEH